MTQTFKQTFKANAARIVACVNAMAGIEDPAGYVKQLERKLKLAEERAMVS